MHVDHCTDCMAGMLLKDVLKMGFGMVDDLVARVRIFHFVFVINIKFKDSKYTMLKHFIVISQAITCRIKDPFPNGRIVNPRLNYGIGQDIRLACKDSTFKMEGQNVLECLPNGSWSNALPKCIKILSCAGIPA